MTKNQGHNFEQVYLHQSQFPDQVYQDYLNGFKHKNIPNKFHYDSVKQSQKWLKLHQQISPSRNNKDCQISYQNCFETVANVIKEASSIEVIGLGSGGGTKDSMLLSCLQHTTRDLYYYPTDVSLSLSVISAQKVRDNIPQVQVKPVVCDLLYADDLINQLSVVKDSQKVITFFGMIPNFKPLEIIPILTNLLEAGDILLMSANLAPGDDYVEGIKHIFHQYENDYTKDWLITILGDIGIEEGQGEIQFTIENDDDIQDLKRVNANFVLKENVSFTLDGDTITWDKNDQVQLFFSYRYTTPKLQTLLKNYGIEIVESWEAPNQEEAVYLCRKL